MEDERKFWVWLSVCLGQGSDDASKVINHFGTAKNLYEATPEEIGRCLKKNRQSVLNILKKYSVKEADQLVKWCDVHNVRILTYYDPDYPNLLKGLVNLPLVLYCVGNIPKWNEQFCCAVVGTRKMTDYGKMAAYDFGYDLSTGGAIVVSGLAIGVDGMAMAGAIKSGGATVAVLGCGIDVCYPKAHRELMHQVMVKGAVITEYPPSTPPCGENFPVRNRIISGMSQATLVVEGEETSGALITANHAVFQKRKLYAVPGKVTDESSDGPNVLIKRGVPAVTEASDILLDFRDMFPDTVNPNRIRRRYLSKKKDEYLDVAREYHVVSSLDNDNGYYGHGLYGGRKPPEDKTDRETKTDPKPEDQNTKAPAVQTKTEVPKPVQTVTKARTDTKVKQSLPDNAVKAEKSTVKPQDKAAGHVKSADYNVVVEKKQHSFGLFRKKDGGKSHNIETADDDTQAETVKPQGNTLAEREKNISEILSGLPEKYLALYNKMVPDVPVFPDEIKCDGYTISDIIAGMTYLEINGVVEASAGGFYIRIGHENVEITNANE